MARSSAVAPEAEARMSALVTVGVVAWCAFAVTAVLVALDPPTAIDHTVQERVASAGSDAAAHAEWLRPASLVVGKLGSTPVEVAVLVLLGIVSLARRWPIQIMVLPVVTLFPVAATVGFFKKAYQRPEPYDGLGDTGRSFPSGHSATAVAVYGGLALGLYLTSSELSRERRALVSVLLTVIGLVVAAMLVRSAHWLSDIVGGAAVGTAWLATVAAVLLRISGGSGTATTVRR